MTVVLFAFVLVDISERGRRGIALARLAFRINTTTPYVLYSGVGAMPDGTSVTGGLVYISVRGCALFRIAGGSSGAVSLVAGSSGVTGFANGYGGNARFFYPYGIVGNVNNKIAYVTDRDNYRVRAVDLVSSYVSTLAGSGVRGSADGQGMGAQFDQVYGIAYHPASGGVLYVADTRIRKIDLPTARVTTISAMTGGVAISKDGGFLYVSGVASIVRLNTSTLTSITIAGGSTVGFADGVGTQARFYNINSMVSTPDESAFIVQDSFNYRIRYLDLETRMVTTIAGNGASAIVDGVDLKSSFLCSRAAIWYCMSPSRCGALIADQVDQGASALRFVQISVITLSHSSTPTEEGSRSSSIYSSQSGTSAVSTTVTAATDVATVTSTMDWTSSVTVSTTKPTSTMTCAYITESETFTVTRSLPPPTSSPSLGITATVSGTSSRSRHTKTLRTRIKSSWTITGSSTQWRCSAVERAQINVSLSDLIEPPSPLADGTTTPSIGITLASTVRARRVNQSATRFLPTVVLTTQPVEREVLMSAPAFLINVTLIAPETAPALHWTVWNVSARGVLLQWVYNKSFDASWHWMLIGPGHDGWLGSNAPLMLDRTVDVEIVMACGGEPCLIVLVRVLAPRYRSSFAEKVALAAQVSQMLSIVSGSSSSGSALGRALATKSVVICDMDTAMDSGVIDFNFVLCAGQVDDAAESPFSSVAPAEVSARSAVVSNVAVVATFAGLILVAGLVWSCSQQSTLRYAVMFVLCAPSSLLPVWTAALTSFASSVTVLIARAPTSRCVPADVLVIIAGTVLAIAPALVILLLWWRKVHHHRHSEPPLTALPSLWVCAAVPDFEDTLMLKRRLFGKLVLLWRRGARRRWKWQEHNHQRDPSDIKQLQPEARDPPPHYSHGALPMRSALTVLSEFRHVWYAGAVDQAVLVLVSTLAVVAGLDNANPALCIGCTSTVLGLLVGQIAVMARCRPYTSLFSFVCAITTTILTCLGVFSQLMFITTSSTSVSGLWMVEASVVCTLIVVGISAVKMCFDASEVVTAVYRRLSVLCGCTSSRRNRFEEPSEGGKEVALCKEVHNVAPPLAVTHESNEMTESTTPSRRSVTPLEGLMLHLPEHDEGDDDDRLYWTADGLARTTTKKEVGKNRLRDDDHGDDGNVLWFFADKLTE
jgi:hypothetical protein